MAVVIPSASAIVLVAHAGGDETGHLTLSGGETGERRIGGRARGAQDHQRVAERGRGVEVDRHADPWRKRCAQTREGSAGHLAPSARLHLIERDAESL